MMRPSTGRPFSRPTPYERVMAHFWTDFIENKLTKPFFMALWVEGEARKGLKKEATELLALLESQLKRKRFFGGDRPGYLDIAAGSFGPWRSLIEELNGVLLVTEDKFPALCQWAKEYSSYDALKPCILDRGKLLAYFTTNIGRYKTAVNAMLQQQKQ